MTYFNNKPAIVINRPYRFKITGVQFLLSVILALIAGLNNITTGWSVLVGGLIATLGQVYFNIRAVKHYGRLDATKTISDTFSAMWGKWALIIVLSLMSVVVLADKIKAGALYSSMFGIYLLGVFLLPILVKRSP